MIIREKQLAVEGFYIKVKKYSESGTSQKHPNIMQRKTGIDEMPLVAGRTLYSPLLKARDIAMIKKELEFRGLPTDGGWKRDLLPRLATHEKYPNTFKVLCPDV